jgi:hypothetical protein
MSDRAVVYSVLADLEERLEKANAELERMAKGRVSELGFDAIRLEGKAEGVRLALSYLREIDESYIASVGVSSGWGKMK